MQDGATQVVEIGVECPKCGQESMVRVATGQENRKFTEVYRVRLLLESVD
jgi:predicted RNA-binding Zn-ribbon protein involved in translation (DUF1610 family)